ncbi:MAG: hypothetical protein ACREJR_02790 [Candidatus Rokuibacteriota bacterium]
MRHQAFCPRRPTAAAGLIALTILALVGPAWADVLHVYDRLNRLRATVDTAANDSSIWTYDAVGNILTITRQPATQTTVLEIPPEAVAGACGVRLLGIGFGATPGQNTVTVNGVAATVQSATATELVVCLGGSSTNGQVVVTTPTGSDTSDGPLSVQAAPTVPTVTVFTPTIATWGTSLGVTGTHFDPGGGLTRVRLGATSLLGPVSGVTATSLTATVPPGATSGRLVVTTPAGSAVASADLFVPLVPYTPADVAITGRWTLGQSQQLTVPATKQALLLFEGSVAQKVCVGTVFAAGAGDVEKAVFQPNGTAMFAPYFGGDTVIELVPLPAAGTSQIRLRNASAASAAVVTTTLHDASDQVQGTIPTDGTATALSFPTPCFRAGRTFTGTAGQRVSHHTTGAVNATLTLMPPTGAALVTTNHLTGTNGFVEPVTLPQTGTYTWWADPPGSGTGTLTLRLSEVVDVETPITPGGAPVTVTLPVPGQQGLLTFGGTAGQRASVQLDQLGFDGSSWISQPGGTVLGPVQAFSAGQVRYVEVPTFPTTGTYTVIVDPTAHYTGSARVTLWTYTDVTGSLTLGVATPVSLTAPGQRALLTFAGTAGQRVTLQTSNPGGSLGTMAASILKPDGTTLLAVPLGVPGLLGTLTLPVAGTYTVVFDPAGMATGSFDLTVATSTGAGLTLAWNGKIRDRVNPSEGLGTDGALDGTLTATLAGGTRTVTQLVLVASGAGTGQWDTIPANSQWLLGAAAGLDTALLNAANGTVSFEVLDGGSVVVFGTDWFAGKFVSGTTLTLTATFSDSSTAVAAVTVP